ncbi:Gfo/Idh/MocA family oxidoreductase [Paenibacillus antri]|uniref:Gfo/Idh/MocA family oxidoreductase n=1 Tax=Paenibacillus antri TaxID=2582848 RepID=A0A5R9G6Z2_9BACL|nr:Gfo/Idh/MocA family oxidoreductase [Paenibacillus antri]TLS50839.1 Gfo/Idh/MocA family oxidoreductase [Paenibacillus antri]
MRIGVIGYGNRIKDVIRVMRKLNPDVVIAGIVDPRYAANGVPDGSDAPPTFPTVDELVRRIEPDGLMIGTRCSLHTRYALEALPTGIPLYLEKPVSTTMEDWRRLKEASLAYATPVVVSHPLRLTTIVQQVKDIVDSGTIGTVEHIQAVNNVPYGGVYFHSWYRDEAETGGLFLQKATHDFDYLNYVAGRKAVAVTAMTSKQVFKGNKPAGLKCVDCEENRTCAESTVGTAEEEKWPYCAFAEDTGNEDSGSALIRYEDGMHASYTQNFFARRQAASRGARFLGYKGTVEFDFTTGLIQVFHHHKARVDRYEFEQGEGHFGGDERLASNFLDIIRNGAASLSTLEDGLISARMCLLARQSAETQTFQTID